MKIAYSDLIHMADETIDAKIDEVTRMRIKKQVMQKIEPAKTKKSRRLTRAALVAAVLVVVFTCSVAAVRLSFWESARNDLGLTELDIPEYTEYIASETEPETVSSAVPEAEAVTEEAANEAKSSAEASEGLTTLNPNLEKYLVPEAEVELISALCSGNQVTAYLAISPVTQQMVDESWPEAQGLYDMADWMVNVAEYVGAEKQDVSTHCSYDFTQMEYDPEAQTLLLRVDQKDSSFTDASAIVCDVHWISQHGQEEPVVTRKYYGQVEIPITEARCVAMECSILVENQYLPQFHGQITGVEVLAGNVTVTVERPNFEDACEALGENAYFLIGDAYHNYWHALSGEEAHTEFTELDAYTYYGRSWDVTICDYLAEAELIMKDGTSVIIRPEDALGNWYADYTLTEEAEVTRDYYSYTLNTALDIDQVKSIVLAGVEYPLHTE